MEARACAEVSAEDLRSSTGEESLTLNASSVRAADAARFGILATGDTGAIKAQFAPGSTEGE